MAALQGVDLEKNSKNTSFDEVKRRAEAKLRGITEEQVELDEIGVGMEEI